MKITRKDTAPTWVKDQYGNLLIDPVIETISTVVSHDKSIEIVVWLYATSTAKNEWMKALWQSRYIFDDQAIAPTYDEETNEMLDVGRNTAENVMPQLDINFDQVDLLTTDAKVWALMQDEPNIFWQDSATPRKFREHWQLQNGWDPFYLDSVPLNPNP